MTISKTISESIATALVRHRFTAEADALRDAEAALAMDVYRYRWSDEDRAKMAMVPPEWLTMTACVEVAGGWGFVSLDFGGARHFKSLAPRRNGGGVLWPRADRYHATRVTVLDGALADRVEAHAKAVDKLDSAIGSAHADAVRTIGAMSTVKLLVEAWPEIAPFAAPHLVAKASLPALRTEELNVRFGLPVEEDGK
jgi:hypothetical protein